MSKIKKFLTKGAVVSKKDNKNHYYTWLVTPNESGNFYGQLYYHSTEPNPYTNGQLLNEKKTRRFLIDLASNPKKYVLW